MRLVKANYSVYAASFNNKLPFSYDNNKQLIEIAGRTCYKSEEKIGEGTADKFFTMLENKGHCAMIEHSWQLKYYNRPVPFYKFLNFLPLPEDKGSTLVAGNIRAFAEWDFPGKHICWEATKEDINKIYEHKRWDMLSATAKLVVDRGVTHEQVRHRPPAYAQESTRWCNYCQDRFNQHITFIIPCWLHDYIEEGEYSFSDDSIPEDLYSKSPETFKWLKSMNYAESSYFDFINIHKWIPGRARCVLPNSLKTEIVITADLAEWQHIFKLRTATDAHEQMQEVMIPLKEEFKTLMPEVFNN